MKKIVISGYYGFDNIGDELVLKNIVDNIDKKNNEILVLSNNPEKTAGLYGVKAVDRWKIKDIIGALWKADLLISGGGSLLQDSTSKNGILYYLGVILLGKLFAKKTMVLSQGIGPIINGRNKKISSILLNRVDYLSVRDQASKDFLQSLGIKKEVILSGDPVFLLDKGKLEAGLTEKLKEEFGIEASKKTILFSLRDWEKGEKIKTEIAKFLADLDQTEYQCIFMPMHYPGDLEFAESLKQKVVDGNKSGTVFIDRELKIEEVISLVKEAQLVVGMRLHSLIIAAALEKRFISISYDPKVTSLSRDFYSEDGLDVESITSEKLQEAFQSRMGSKFDRGKLKKIKERARLPFSEI